MSSTEPHFFRCRSLAPSSTPPALPRPAKRAPLAWALMAWCLGVAGLVMSAAHAADTPAAGSTTPVASTSARAAPKPAPKPAPKAAPKPAPKPAGKAAPKAPQKASAKTPAKVASKAPAQAKPTQSTVRPQPAPRVSPPVGAVVGAKPTAARSAAVAAPPGAPSAPASSAAARPPALVASGAARIPATTDLVAWCESVSTHLSGLSSRQCAGSGLQAGDGRSVQGVPLWHRDVLPLHGPARLRVLVLGGIHGDEMASVNVVFDWIDRSVKKSDDAIHWRMVPLVNPDGLMRKPSTRVNARGVDLNRNFPTPDWNSSAQTYWVSRTGRDPRRFPGPKAMSEPETQWLQKQVDLFKPHLIVSVHAPYGVLDFDGPPPPPDKLGSLHLDQVGIYPGSLGNYGGVVRRVPVVTLELRNAAKVAPVEVAAMWSDLLDWIDRRRDNMAQLRSPDDGRGPRTR
jgi:murein peptide amidase A